MRAPSKPLGQTEFVVLLALMTSVTALSTDIMLPALAEIGTDLGVPDPNEPQLVISALFLGLSVGQLLAGPLSDALGRRPVIFLGYAIFLVGALLSLVTTDFTTMLIGRALQGLGAAGPRIMAMAVVRDCTSGREMARILSIIMAVFIFVPVVAPAIGQIIVLASGWRMTFGFLMLVALVTLVWYGLRQPETLAPGARRPLGARAILSGFAEVLWTRVTLGTTLALGLIFTPFIGYLSASQQIFQSTYDTGQWFPLWFAAAALCIGAASMVNARLVMRLGMRKLTGWAVTALGIGSVLFLVPVLASGGQPPFWAFMLWISPAFFCVGIAFGNLNALAMEPLGHIAGLGAALVGSLSTLIALPGAWLVGVLYDGGITPLVGGFALCGVLAMALFRWAVAGYSAPAGDQST